MRRRQIDRGRQVDLLATRGEEVLLVETKAYVASPVSTAAVQQAAALRSVYPDLRAALPGYHARAALVVNAEPGVSAALILRVRWVWRSTASTRPVTYTSSLMRVRLESPEVAVILSRFRAGAGCRYGPALLGTTGGERVARFAWPYASCCACASCTRG